MDVTKRSQDKINKETNKQKSDNRTVKIGCASLEKFMKKELDEDAHMNWEEFMDWIHKQKDIDTPESDNKSGKNI